MKFLSPDSGFMRGLSDAVDAIWINILMLVTSIPIITIGAALTAGVCFPLPPRPVLRRSTEKKVPVTAETGIMSAITVRALAA